MLAGTWMLFSDRLLTESTPREVNGTRIFSRRPSNDSMGACFTKWILTEEGRGEAE